jgi:folate-binding protein YgfZ
MSPFHDALSAATAAAYYAPLDNLRVLSASGADAIDFLHGQLTQDVVKLDGAHAALAGYCTAKGRLLATLVMWRMDQGAPQSSGVATSAVAVEPADAVRLHALVRADAAAALQKRLSMFVLRAKVKLSLSTLNVAGIWTDADSPELAACAGGALPQQAWQRADLSSGTWIAAPAAKGKRWWWIATDAQRDGALDLARQLQVGDAAAWHAGDLAAGVPWVGALTQDVFIPQTVNLDLIGGVSFTKGCYPGQEVVARSHYRGTVKRRMAYGIVAGTAAADIQPGTDVYDQDQPGEPCGRVVDAAGTGDAAILFEITLASLPDASLHWGAPDGPRIKLQALPYELA